MMISSSAAPTLRIREQYPYKKPPTYNKEWYGTEAQVRATASYFATFGWNVDISNGEPWHGSATITANLNGDSPDTGSYESGSIVSGSTVTWGFEYNTVQKDFLQSADQIPWLNYLTATQLGALIEAEKNPPPDGSFPKFDASNMTQLQMSCSLVAWSMIKRGFKTVPVDIPILTRQMTVPETQTLTFFTDYTKRVFAKTTLVNTENVPSNYADLLDQDTDPSPSDTDGITYIYGWQKQPPKIGDASQGTIQVTQQWVYGLYPQNVFGPRL